MHTPWGVNHVPKRLTHTLGLYSSPWGIADCEEPLVAVRHHFSRRWKKELDTCRRHGVAFPRQQRWPSADCPQPNSRTANFMTLIGLVLRFSDPHNAYVQPYGEPHRCTQRHYCQITAALETLESRRWRRRWGKSALSTPAQVAPDRTLHWRYYFMWPNISGR